MIEIETGVPMPEQLTETIKKLMVGQSFVYKKAQGLQTAFRRLGMKCISRKLPDGTYRIWRME